MKKVFKCDATGEEIVIEENPRTDPVLNANRLAMLLIRTDGQTIREALDIVLSGNKTKFIHISQAIHGRTYNAIRHT